MKTFLLLITFLNYTHFMFCCVDNVTEDYSNMICPVHFIRRKRGYTRWRNDPETTVTSEFIVKVPDDEIPTTSPRGVIAINIQPLTKKAEKIIVGAPLLPRSRTSESSEELNDYTRFVLPTTIPVTRVGDLYLAQVPSILIESLNQIRPKAPNPHRDESPPSGPQFLTRSSLMARQFAPVTNIAFSRATLTKEHTSQDFDDLVFKITNRFVTRTPATDIEMSLDKQSESDLSEISPNEILSDDDHEHNENEATRTPFPPLDSPYRSLYTMFDSIHKQLNSKYTTPRLDYDKDEPTTPLTDKDTNSYNQWFYNEVDNDDENKIGNDVSSSTKGDVNNVLSDADLNNYEDEESMSIQKLNSSELQIQRKMYNDDVQFIPFSFTTPVKGQEQRNLSCNMIKIRPLNFNSPFTYPEILTQLKKWAENSPVAKWVDITNKNLTTMENTIHMMVVDDPSSGQVASAKQTVLIVAGIQGRDHHAVTAAMYVLYELIEGSDSHSDLLKKYRFWVIPVFNPDGYDYSMTFPHRRDWAKNLRQNWGECRGRRYCENCDLYGLRCTPQTCYGVHLDRNFEYQWISSEELRTDHACGSLYAGPRQLSETETIALTNFLHKIDVQISTFIAFKEGDVLGVMYPHSHTRKRRARDSQYRHLASRASAAAYGISGRPYVAGQTSEFLPLYAGGIEDWMEGHLGIDNTYTIMLYRPSDLYNTNLNTKRIVLEAYAAMDTLLIQSGQPPPPPLVKFVRAGRAPSCRIMPFTITTIITLAIVPTVSKMLFISVTGISVDFMY